MGESLTERRRVIDEVLRDVKIFYGGRIPHFCSFGILLDMYFVYVLKLANGNVYVGSTDSLKRRLLEHQSGLSTYTKKYLPIELSYCEVYKLKADALERERKLKQHKSTLGHLRKRIKKSLGQDCKSGG